MNFFFIHLHVTTLWVAQTCWILPLILELHLYVTSSYEPMFLYFDHHIILSDSLEDDDSYDNMLLEWNRSLSTFMLGMQCFMSIDENGFYASQQENFHLHLVRFWTLVELGCWICRYYFVNENVPIEEWVCEDNFMSRVTSHDIDICFWCWNMLGMCNTKPNCLALCLKLYLHFFYHPFVINLLTPTNNKEQRFHLMLQIGMWWHYYKWGQNLMLKCDGMTKIGITIGHFPFNF